MDVLFGAGWIGAALFVGMMAAAVSTARRARAAVLIALSAILMIGSVEGIWSIGVLDRRELLPLLEEVDLSLRARQIGGQATSSRTHVCTTPST